MFTKRMDDRDIVTSNIEWAFKNQPPDLPLDYRAIGCTGTGDEICIDVYDHVGALFFYDWVGEPWARMYDMGISFDGPCRTTARDAA